MANAVQKLAATTPGKESMAMESFAKALRQVREEEDCIIDCSVYYYALLVTYYYC